MVCRVLSCFALALFVLSGTASAQSATGPEVGASVDGFSLQDQKGTSHNLSDLLADGPVALVVYRSADW
jgi:cytochrome oxidase Cu insertion factor (SCO1/SenC/PrrC family)